MTGTGHPKIMRAEEERLSEEEVDSFTGQLQRACNEHDCDAIQSILLNAVTGFDAKDGISDAFLASASWKMAAVPPGPERDAKIITGHFK